MNNMTKGKAFFVLLVLVLALLGISYLDFYGIDANKSYSASDIKLGLDLAGGVSITYQVVGEETPTQTDMSDTISKLQQRVWKYNTEAVVYQEGLNRIGIEIPGVTDAEAIFNELSRPGALYFICQKGSDGTDNYYATGEYDEDGKPVWALSRSIEEIKADGCVVLEGTDVLEAKAGTSTDSMGNQELVVGLTMNDTGKQKFADATTKAYNAGKQTIGIYYDGKLYSVPTVQVPITDGVAQISGMNDYDEAEKLASTIRIGGLNLELETLHSKVVGAQLGVDAISTSVKAGAIGLAIVVVFMIVVYFLSGLAASFALTLYVAMIVMLIRAFNLTLTLSGIAGIILSIGMAVDANVIIFARIREELATGKTVKSSMKIGFEKALSAIVDGNITTLIAAAVLWLLGPGTVKGFAQTLALGIVLSMFTALVLTRLIMNALYVLGLKSEKLYGIGKEPKAVDFLSKRVAFFGISAAVIIAGFVMMGVNKSKTGDMLNLSLEFKGGTATTVTFNESRTLEQINSDILPGVEALIGSGVQIQTVQGSNEVIFKSDKLTDAQSKALTEMFVNSFGVNAEKITTETISSTISDEMTRDTIIAVVVAIVCMLIYIRIRFKDIRLGAASVMALMHDVLVVLAFYAAARISVSNTFIACMLTIVGYSINATIVIFDRIRENLNEMRKESIEKIINRSIAQTLSRSLFTSLTTFIMVAVLYILGVPSIKDFALPLMVGIFCGAYSSVCLAGSLWYILKNNTKKKA